MVGGIGSKKFTIDRDGADCQQASCVPAAPLRPAVPHGDALGPLQAAASRRCGEQRANIYLLHARAQRAAAEAEVGP